MMMVPNVSAVEYQNVVDNALKFAKPEILKINSVFESLSNTIGKNLLVLFIAYYAIAFIIGFYVGFHYGYMVYEELGFLLRVLNGIFVGLKIGFVLPFMLIYVFIIEPIIRFIRDLETLNEVALFNFQKTCC